MRCGIYKITNPKGAIYIGSSKNLDWRMAYYQRYPQHLKNQRKIYNSLMKYGPENHSFEVVRLCEENDRLRLERQIGLALNVLGRDGLNLKLPGKGEKVKSFSAETRKKMSESGRRRANQETEKRRAQAKKTFTGRKHSKEHIEKRKMCGEKNPMFGRRGELHPNFGKKKSEEERKATGDTMRKLFKSGWISPNSRMVVDTETGKEYWSVKAAAEDIGLERGTLQAMLRGANPNRTNIRYANKEYADKKRATHNRRVVENPSGTESAEESL